jgi:hypothetical protein
VQRRNHDLLTPRSSGQGNLTVLVIDGMRKLKQTKPGTISKFFCICISSAQTNARGNVGAQGYANADVVQHEDDLVEQALGAFANLSTATAVYR